MGKYIGRDSPYGFFDTQVIDADGVASEFSLLYKVSSPSSILVTISGSVQQPAVDYSITDGGSKIVFTSAPAAAFDVVITYLGKELTTTPNTVTVENGNKGDVTVSNSGNTWLINSGVVTYAKIQSVSTTNRILGRTSGSGTIEEIPCTAAGRALLDDVDAAAQRTTLGLGTLATQNGTSSGTNTGDQNVFSTISVAGQNSVIADSTSDTLTLAAGSGITLTTTDSTDTITISSTAISDGNKTDITVSNSGATWAINNTAVTYAKIQNVSSYSLLGRFSGTDGAIEEISLGRNLFFNNNSIACLPTFASGSATSPGILFSDAVDTGLFIPTSGAIAISTAGVERFRLINNTLYLGNGESSSSPASATITSTSASGTDVSPGTLTIESGASTGNANPGSIIFRTSDSSGSSGSSVNSKVERLRISSGIIYIGNGIESATPNAASIRATRGLGTNIAGAGLSIFGGESTGTASGGTITFNTTPAGTVSGSSLNSSISRLHIAASGNIGIGTTGPETILDIKGVDVENRLTEFANSTSGSYIAFQKSRGATVNTNTIVQNGDELGGLIWRGANGTGYTSGAAIIAQVDGTPGASNDMPTGIIFATTPDGSGTPIERMRIAPSGFIGIGSTNPGANLAIDNNTTSQGGYGLLITQYSNDIQGADINLRKSRSGTIGTNTIVQNGDVIGAIRFWGNNGTSFDQCAVINSVIDATPGASNDMPTALQFLTRGDNSATLNERLRITSAGNVGIGTSAPTKKLTIVGSGSDVELYYNLPSIRFCSSPNRTKSYYVGANISDSVDGGFIIGTGADITDGTAQLKMNENGNFALNAVPDNNYRLLIGGPLKLQFIDSSAEPKYDTSSVIMGVSGFGTVYYGYQHKFICGNPKTPEQSGSANGTEAMRINISGQMLMRTTTAFGGLFNMQLGSTAGVDNQGIIIKAATAGNYGMVFQDSSGTAIGRIQLDAASTQYVTTSDYRLKEDIKPMPSGLNKILQLKPCTWKWKNGAGNGQGFIAHELAEIIPEAVSGEKDAVDSNGNISPQGVDTGYIVATLVAAVKELSEKVEQLENKLKNL